MSLSLPGSTISRAAPQGGPLSVRTIMSEQTQSPTAAAESGGSVCDDQHDGGADTARIKVVAHRAAGYALRTKHNADSAGLTVAIAVDFTTAGERLTARVAQGKYLAIPIQLEHDKAGLRVAKAMREVDATTLNVAGNGIHTLAQAGLTQAQVNQHVHDLIAVAHSLRPITKIVTGGQTGVDIAGAIAAYALGIPAVVTMPAGFKQRGPDGLDYCGTAQGVTAQIINSAAALAKGGAVGSAPHSQAPQAGAMSNEVAQAKVSLMKVRHPSYSHSPGHTSSVDHEPLSPGLDDFPRCAERRPLFFAQYAISERTDPPEAAPEHVGSAHQATPLERELFERLEELMEYSDNLRGSGVHKRCMDVLQKVGPNIRCKP